MTITIKEIYQLYILHKELRPDSHKQHKNAIKQLAKYINNNNTNDNFPINLITNEDVLKWRKKKIIDDKVKNVTWNHYVRHLKALFGFAVSQNYIEMNPFSKTLLKIEGKKKKTLNKREIEIIQKNLNNLCHNRTFENVGRLAPAWFWQTVNETFRQTGIRLNQLLHLRVKDYHPDDKTLFIAIQGSKAHREHIVPVSNELSILLDTLSKKVKERLICLPVDEIINHCIFIDHRRLKNNYIDYSEAQLFNVNLFKIKNKRKTMDSHQVQNFYKALSKIIAVKVSSHRFRHTIATELMKSPERNLYIVNQLLGHSSLDVTLEYIEPDIEQIRFAVNQVI